MATTAANPPDGVVVTQGIWNNGIAQSTTQQLSAPTSVVITAGGVTFVGPWLPINPFSPTGLAHSLFNFGNVYVPQIYLYGDNAGNNVNVNFVYYNAAKASPSSIPLFSGAPGLLNKWLKYTKFVAMPAGYVWGRLEISSVFGTSNLLTSNESTGSDSGSVTDWIQATMVHHLYGDAPIATVNISSTTTADANGGFIAPFQGPRCLSIQTTGPYQDGAALQVSCSPSTQYTFSFYATQVSGGGTNGIAAVTNSASPTFNFNIVTLTSLTWTRVT